MDPHVSSSSWVVLGQTACVGAFIAIVIFLFNLVRRSNQEPVQSVHATGDVKKVLNNDKSGGNGETAGKKDKKIGLLKKKDSRTGFSHQWLACCLKAHGGPVLGIDFSPNGKFMASCSEDRTVYLWRVKEFNQKEHKPVRANVELDHLTKVRFSPDSRAFIGSLYSGETVRVFKIGKKDDGGLGNIQAAYDFQHKHAVEVINIGIATNGKFIATFCRDTTIRVWDLKGELLSMIDSKQMNHTYGAVSPCGRFVASSGFTPDVKVWEVLFDKSGSFREVTRAFELKGHSASVLCFSFSSDSSRMASVSKDGTWRLWNTVVEYQKNQDPYQLSSWRYDHPSTSSLIALSPDGRSVVIATGSNASLYSVSLPECQQTFEDIHNGCTITAVDFSTDSRYFVTAGDKHVSVFYNVAGYRSVVTELETKKKVAPTQALRERLQQQIDEANEMIKNVEEKRQ